MAYPAVQSMAEAEKLWSAREGGPRIKSGVTLISKVYSDRGGHHGERSILRSIEEPLLYGVSCRVLDRVSRELSAVGLRWRRSVVLPVSAWIRLRGRDQDTHGYCREHTPVPMRCQTMLGT